MMQKEKWWIVARKEGRLCRLCNEPVAKAYWKDKQMDHLCPLCYLRETELQPVSHWRLAR